MTTVKLNNVVIHLDSSMVRSIRTNGDSVAVFFKREPKKQATTLAGSHGYTVTEVKPHVHPLVLNATTRCEGCKNA